MEKDRGCRECVKTYAGTSKAMRNTWICKKQRYSRRRLPAITFATGQNSLLEQFRLYFGDKKTLRRVPNNCLQDTIKSEDSMHEIVTNSRAYIGVVSETLYIATVIRCTNPLQNLNHPQQTSPAVSVDTVSAFSKGPLRKNLRYQPASPCHRTDSVWLEAAFAGR